VCVPDRRGGPEKGQLGYRRGQRCLRMAGVSSLSLCVRLSVCVFASLRLCACVSACLRACVSRCMSVCACVCASVCVQVQVWVWVGMCERDDDRTDGLMHASCRPVISCTHRAVLSPLLLPLFMLCPSLSLYAMPLSISLCYAPLYLFMPLSIYTVSNNQRKREREIEKQKGRGSRERERGRERA